MEIKVLHQVMEWNEDVSAEVRKTLSEAPAPERLA